nr:probable peptide/nitrate transporter At3g43790 [Setaria viridis]
MGSEEAPLLLPAPAVEGCPGCAMERRKASSKGRIPYKELFFVGVTSLASSLPITCLFPFIYFMVRDFHISETEEDIGFYAGFLGIVSVSSLIYKLEIIKVGLLEASLHRFPYLLPCLSVSSFATIVLISCTWLPETIHKHKVPEKDTKIVKALSSKDNYRDSPRRKSLLQNKPWVSTMLPYCLFSLHDTAYSEILSLWAVSDRKYGGLSFSTEDIGEVLAMAGASLLVYQFFIYRWVHKVLGTVNSSRVASAVCIGVLATYPFMTYLSGAKLSFALYSAAMMKSALAITVTTGNCLLQNNAVCQEQRGTANGISTTAMSFFKSIAPVGAGALFSWAQKRQDATFLPGDQVVFVLLNLVQLLGLISTFEPFLVLPALPE